VKARPQDQVLRKLEDIKPFVQYSRQSFLVVAALLGSRTTKPMRWFKNAQ
jgi:hypothetical protein